MHTLAVVALALATGGSQPADALKHRPLDAVTAIIEAFRAHPVVALEEQHGEERSHAFRLQLIRDPRFPSVVHDIVVEFGNSRYQGVIDRFIDGEAVGDTELRRVWQDTTQPHAIWDRPIYEQFFRAVREVNAVLPRERRLRVLLGDPPIDWDAVRAADDLRDWRARRSRHASDVVMREVLSKGRRGLVLYGAMHLFRQNPFQGINLIERVEAEARIKAFVVLDADLRALGVDPVSWPVPSVALTRGSALENNLDAALYLGPASTRRMSRLSASLCADASYRSMRAARMVLDGHGDDAATLEGECGAAQPPGKPDFSGHWIPAEDPSGTPARRPPAGGPPPPPRTLSSTITHSATELKVVRRLQSADRETVTTFVYRLDGTESVNQMGPLAFRTTAEWHGDRLVLSSIVSANGNDIGNVREEYRLESGQLVVETTRKTPAGTFSGKTIHTKG